MEPPAKRRVNIGVAVGGMLIVATLVTALSAVALQYYFAREAELDHALTQYQQISSGVTEQLSQLDFVAEHTTRQASEMIRVLGEAKANDALLGFFAQALQSNDNLYSIHVSGDDDSFIQLISLKQAYIRERLQGQNGDRWLLVVHSTLASGRTKQSSFYDADFNLTKQTTGVSNYLPSERSWFDRAPVDDVAKSAPYLFQNLRVTGLTYASRVPDMGMVMGVDIVLSSIETKLKDRFAAPEGQRKTESYLFLEGGRLIATNQNVNISDTLPMVPPLVLSEAERALVKKTAPLKVSHQDGWEPLDFTVAGEPKGYVTDLLKIVSDMTGLEFDLVDGRGWDELVASYQEGKLDILHSIAGQSHQVYPGVYGEPLYHLPYGLLTRVDTPSVTRLKALAGHRIGMRQGWSVLPMLRANFPNLEWVTFPTGHMAIEALQNGEIDGVLDLAPVLAHKTHQRFYQGVKLRALNEPLLSGDFTFAMAEADKPVLQLINRALAAIPGQQRQELNAKWLDKTFSHYTHVPHQEIISYANLDNADSRMHQLQVDNETQYLFVAPLPRRDGEYLAVMVPEAVIMATVNQRILYFLVLSLSLLALLLPLSWLFGRPISRPINALRRQTEKIEQRRYNEVKVIDSRIKEVYELSLSVRSMAGAIATHHAEQQEFIDAIIRIIANAIDEKSPYTGGHCHRVPELGIMLAAAAERANEGSFKSFKFASEDERREFRIAAWLHDCGKITTPEYIVDKATKLETNYNRIHEILTRFEVLWRDAEIEALQQRLAGADEQWVNAQLKAKHRALQQDYEFIAATNIGHEFLGDAATERVKAIASRQWVRHFDNTLGLGPQEEARYARTPLPAVEFLLADKPEHVIERDRPMELDPALGINMVIPEHLYNHGEIYNLCIRRGTLSPEDRFKVNEHMISGIKMLENIPFPPELARVPRYASTHHETLRGDGYPRKLSGDELSLPERMLALADVFEALTASDRPYKKAKPLSVAIDILHNMALEQHLDIEVFHLFISSGVYLEYAKTYLSPEQIDEVDIGRYIAKAG